MPGHYHVLVDEPHHKPQKRTYVVRTQGALNREVELERLDSRKTVDFTSCDKMCLGPEPANRHLA